MPGFPVCPGCRLQTLSPVTGKQRHTWARSEGLKWGSVGGKAACFFLCKDCHEATWNADSRSPNRYDGPGRRHKAPGAGHFYVTTAPPEYLRPVLQRVFTTASANAAPAPSTGTSLASSSGSSAPVAFFAASRSPSPDHDCWDPATVPKEALQAERGGLGGRQGRRGHAHFQRPF